MNSQQYSLPPIGGLLSFPTEKIMEHGLDHQLLDSPGLPMHIMLGRMTVDALASALPEGAEFDIDTARSLTTVYHATRQAADYGKAGKHPDSKVNEFMQTHGDMEYALKQAKNKGLSPAIIKGIRDYIINPAYRENGYFPHETLQKDGKINWTEAIPMLTSWLIAGVITRTDKRFDDLRSRRSAEIGKLELPYWKMKIDANEEVSLPQPIVDIAIREGTYKDEADIIEGIRKGEVTDAIMGKWILDGYEEWANGAIAEYSELTGIGDFYAFLEKTMDTIGDAESDKKAKIKHEFELMLGRKLNPGEFIPYVDGIELLFKRMRGLKTKETQEGYKKRVERIMRNIEKIVRRLAKKPQELEQTLTSYTYDGPLPSGLSQEQENLARILLGISGNPEFQIMLSIFVEAKQLQSLIENNVHPSIVGISEEGKQRILTNITIVYSLYERFRKHVSLGIEGIDDHIASMYPPTEAFFQEGLSSMPDDLVPLMISRFQSEAPPINSLIRMNLNVTS